MKKVLEPLTSTVKQTAEETSGDFQDTTKAIELKGEKENIANDNEMEDLKKYGTNFDSRLLEPSREVANSKNTSHFRLQVDPISKWLHLKNFSIALHEKSVSFTDSDKKLGLGGDILDMMTFCKLKALSI